MVLPNQTAVLGSGMLGNRDDRMHAVRSQGTAKRDCGEGRKGGRRGPVRSVHTPPFRNGSESTAILRTKSRGSANRSARERMRNGQTRRKGACAPPPIHWRSFDSSRNRVTARRSTEGCDSPFHLTSPQVT